jgi:hypothetical protein
MKLQDVLNEADMQALEIDDYGFAKPKTDDDDDGGDVVKVKPGNDAMQAQLMKIIDSEESDDVKIPVRTVTTDDGKEIRVEHGEAEAILQILQMPMKSDEKINIMKAIQNAPGLEKMIEFVNSKGMVK